MRYAKLEKDLPVLWIDEDIHQAALADLAPPGLEVEEPREMLLVGDGRGVLPLPPLDL
jgi:hypothetical protein